MDHTYVEKHDLLEAYLKERLGEEERDAFEAHYFSCETCLERLETADGFREGMRQAAAEDLAGAIAVRAQLSLLASLAALSRRHRLALAGAFLLLAALPAAWLMERNRRLENQLAESAVNSEQQRTTLEARLLSLEQASADDRVRLTEELTLERQARAATPQVARPEINVPLVMLAMVRSGQTSREPVSQVPLSSNTDSVILAAELASVDYPAYSAVLSAADGRDIWHAGGLHPDGRDTLILLLPAKMLQPGDYRLTIDGAKDDGKAFLVADYPFRVERQP